MSSDQYGWPELDPNEIIAPTNSSNINWNTKPGSTVRIGQLLATIVTNADSSSPSGSNKLLGTATTLTGSTDGNTAVDSSSSVPVKPKIIRARRINRKVKPVASTSATTFGDSSKAICIDKQVGLNKEDEPKRAESSFLGQYLKSTFNTNQKVAQSKEHPKKEDQSDNAGQPSNIDVNVNVASSSVTPSLSKQAKNNMREIRAHMDGFLHTYVTIQCRRDSHNKNRLMYVLGKIEPCNHPTVIDGLCAVCGQAITSPYNQSANNHTNGRGGSMSHGGMSTTNGAKEASTQKMTLSGGVTVSISTEYAQTLSTDTSQSLRSAKKLNLVLDLDHTLLHATADQRASSLLEKCQDVHTILLPFMEGHPYYQGGAVNMSQPHYVKLRPHLAEFLCAIMDQYEVTIYTAGTRGYAEKICEVIARHVSNYLRKEKKGGDEGNDETPGCLDERDLLMLKDRVKNLTRHKDEYLKLKQQQDKELADLENKKEESNESSNSNGEVAQAEGGSLTDDNGGTHMMAGGEDEEDSTDSNDKKRKRVTFMLPEDNVSNDKKVRFGDVKSALNIKDPREELQKLQLQLENAEKCDAEAESLRMKIFGSRIISRTDVSDLGRDVKSLKRVFPCGGMMAAIVDDREDVWANADNNSTGRKGEPPHNLLLCKPYHWKPFQKYADVNNSAGVDLTESLESHDSTSMDESNEHQLLWTGDILRRIHERFYSSSLSEEERDKLSVPKILKQMRHEVFNRTKPSTTILLSGLVPLHKQNISFDAQSSPRPPVIRYAEELGSSLVREVSNDLTHVVAARDGTDKILRARNIPGCAIVTISWLMECYWSCKNVDIKKHILGKMPLPRLQTEVRPMSILLSDGSDSEEEDDDFFSNFEEEMNN